MLALLTFLYGPRGDRDAISGVGEFEGTGLANSAAGSGNEGHLGVGHDSLLGYGPRIHCGTDCRWVISQPSSKRWH